MKFFRFHFGFHLHFICKVDCLADSSWLRTRNRFSNGNFWQSRYRFEQLEHL